MNRFLPSAILLKNRIRKILFGINPLYSTVLLLGFLVVVMPLQTFARSADEIVPKKTDTKNKLISEAILQPDVNGILYVDGASTTAGDGSSWSQPLHYLSDAITAANADMSILEIHVAKGIYYPTGIQNDTSRHTSFALLRGQLKVLGGYPNGGGDRTTDGSQPTVLSGDINVPNDSSDNSVQVMVIAGVDSTADSLIVDGFTISGGQADVFSYRAYNGQVIRGIFGGGIYCMGLGANIMIRNCIIEHNTSISNGGGVLINFSSVQMDHIILQENSASYGGGMVVDQSSHPVLDHMVFRRNTASSRGGGFLTHSFTASPILKNSIIRANKAVYGGGISIGGGAAQYYNLEITGNVAENGGGVYNGGAAVYTNVTVCGNWASIQGGGIYSEFARMDVHNSIISGNTAPEANDLYLTGNGSDDGTTITNSIFSNLDADLHVQVGFTAFNNLHSDPQLNQLIHSAGVPFEGGDYRLKSTSPAVDAGNNQFIQAWDSTDVAGDPRIYGIGGVADMGAYESPFGVIVLADNNGIVYVDSSVATAGDGSSWTKALRYMSVATKYANLKEGIKEIHVAKGIYFPTGIKEDTSRSMSFSIYKSGLKILGGYPRGGGIRNAAVNKTILSGNINGEGDNQDNSYHVMKILMNEQPVDSLILDGFEISGGYANLDSWDRETGLGDVYGGGMQLTGQLNDSVVIRNCQFLQNSAYSGGGLVVAGKQIDPLRFVVPEPVIQNCLFQENRLLDMDLQTGVISMGAGASSQAASPLFDSCAFIGNFASGGSTIGNYRLAAPVFKKCIIANNIGSLGAVMLNAVQSKPKVINCLINDNVAIGSDQANPFKGIIINLQASVLHLINTTMVNNKVNSSDSANVPFASNLVSSSIYVTNSLAWGNTGAFYLDSLSSSTEINYSLVEGMAADPTLHNLEGTQATDLFVDSAAGDYRLKPGTIVVNAGLNDSIAPFNVTTDLNGEPRFYETTVDIGAYESQGGTLPVKMSRLVGSQNGQDHVILSWTTYMELGNKGFEIQRSADGSHFVDLQFVTSQASGENSQSALNYRYDMGFITQPTYYRLKQMDRDGHPQLSNVVYVEATNKNNGLLIYPNPAHDVLHLRAPVQLSKHPRIIIIDLSGRVLLQKPLTDIHSQVNVSSLADGIYFLKYVDDQHSSVMKFIKK